MGPYQRTPKYSGLGVIFQWGPVGDFLDISDDIWKTEICKKIFCKRIAWEVSAQAGGHGGKVWLGFWRNQLSTQGLT